MARPHYHLPSNARTTMTPAPAVVACTQSPADDAAQAASWQAELTLRFAPTARGTRLLHKSHRGPLYVQRPFYPEGKELAHVYLLHPPGGLVSGDDLQIRLLLDNGARVLCTTPGAGRVYRARVDQSLQRQRVQLHVGTGGSLEWLPLETLVFPGAHTALDTEVTLDDGARCCLWDVLVLGLPANGLGFDNGHVHQRLRITRNGVPLLHENLRVDAANLTMRHGSAALRAQPVNALFACGPFTSAALATVDTGALGQAVTVQNGALRGLTRHGELLLGRYLGPCAQEARSVFVQWWQTLRPLLLQRPASVPAIWST